MAKKVQIYLDQHGIPGLFEELMGKIVRDMPTEPLPFIVQILQKKCAQLGHETVSLRKSAELKPGTLKSHADEGDVPRGYDKPWLTNTRKHKAKKGGAEETRKSKSEWDSSNKTPAADFDELFEFRNMTKQVDNLKLSKSFKDSPQHFNQSNKVFRPMSTDELNDEISCPVSSKAKLVPNESDSDSTKDSLGSYKKGKQVNAKKHKKELLEFVNSQNTNKVSNATENDDDDGYDEAFDVVENNSDLEAEGVKTTGNNGGKKHSKSYKPKRDTSLDATVKMSICAMCARLTTGISRAQDTSDDSSQSSSSSAVNFPKKHAGTLDAESDEDFESVSQVTGPRAPVWQDNDSNVSTITPRKGTNMLQKSTHDTRHGHLFSAREDRNESRNSVAKSAEFSREPLQSTWQVVEDSDGSTVVGWKPNAK